MSYHCPKHGDVTERTTTIGDLLKQIMGNSRPIPQMHDHTELCNQCLADELIKTLAYSLPRLREK